ncbi:MAG: FabA/FabZ family ACP-dehydratase [Legionellales bacterium]|jgi:3-hydroxyacyl-[acyl-carrier-protein] dehydratase
MDFLRFSMIDEVVSLDQEQRTMVCLTRVPETSFIFDAHFPSFPILPGVFMIETIAQASGMLSLALNQFKKMAFLFGVDETRFRDFVAPGSLLEVRVHIIQQGSGYAVAQGEIFHQDKLVANAQVRLRLSAVPNKEIEEMLRSRAQMINIYI